MIEHLVILAPGLLGASVAAAAHSRGVARKITIWARRAETREEIRAQPWCSAVSDTPESAVSAATLVVLAAPVESIVQLAGQIGSHLPVGCIVTDVGSVKGHLSRVCHAAMPAHAAFVGSHPMAGSQKTGWANASPELFQGRVCFVTPLEKTDGTAVTRVSRFWSDLGSEVSVMGPDEHDEVVAHISHLPQAVATSLCTLLSQRNMGWRNFAGGGLRDTTRIAASDAGMWIEIFQQNREEVLRALGAFEDEIHSFKAALANKDWPEIRTRLERGKMYRDGFRP